MESNQKKSSVLIIMEEVDNALDIYSNHPEIKPLITLQFRQKLINYVINKIKRDCICSQLLPKLPYASLQLRLRLETHIHHGVHKILCSNSELVFSYIEKSGNRE